MNGKTFAQVAHGHAAQVAGINEEHHGVGVFFDFSVGSCRGDELEETSTQIISHHIANLLAGYIRTIAGSIPRSIAYYICATFAPPTFHIFPLSTVL